MRITRILIAVSALLLVAQPALAQFGQSNRLTDLAARLSRDADMFADTAYNAYTSSFRNNRSSRMDIETVMSSQQFAASSRIFYRMVVDRRRNQDLRSEERRVGKESRSQSSTNKYKRQRWK